MRVLLAVCLVLGVSATAAAQPPAPTLVAPRGVVEASTLTFTWRAASGAAWYQLYIADAATPGSPRFSEWYTVAQTHCIEGMCSVTVTADVGVGERQWWIRPWNADGYGPWSASATFFLRETPKAWDAVLPVADRFVILQGGDAVLDRETGLVWHRSWSTTLTSWYQAFAACAARSSGPSENRRRGFRLPTLDELTSIIGPSGLPAGHPFLETNAAISLWTSTVPVDGATTRHYAVSSTNGLNAEFSNDLASNLYWCVRAAGGIR